MIAARNEDDELRIQSLPTHRGITALRRILSLVAAVAIVRAFAPWWCGRHASELLDGDPSAVRALAEEAVAFEADDDGHGRTSPPADRFAGEWALVTHQMNALGLAQTCLQHPEWRARYASVATKAALESMREEMRDFGTRAWQEDALDALDGPHGHAYLAYSALAIAMARRVDPAFPSDAARVNDRVIAAFERRLLASRTGLIETYPDQAYPTDVAAVAAAIAVHGQVTGIDHGRVLRRWADGVVKYQIDPKSGFVHQRMRAGSGEALDAPRGSGTGLAAYYAGFADGSVARTLADALFQHESTFFGFGAIREYADGRWSGGDVDSGPVLLGVSVAATGFALAPAKSFARAGDFGRLYRTVDLFGLPIRACERLHFGTGGPIGNALMFAFLTALPAPSTTASFQEQVE